MSMLCSFRFALATLESKLCRDVWQAWHCEQPVTKHMSNPKSVVSKADVYICAGRCVYLCKQMCIFVQAGYLEDLIIVMLKLMKLLPQVPQIM